MAGLRELLAVALGALLGLLLVAAPRTALQLSVVGGPQRPRGDYGSDGDVGDTWVWLVRALGVGCLLVAAVIGYGAFF
ncbi:hypothetical protein [Haloparvum sp. PAK95]|uniref:hypothetical protein n=1 Tax=Haloparvum sp. PAK95 TaxID=3418962 RepID=UPI003D2F383E